MSTSTDPTLISFTTPNNSIYLYAGCYDPDFNLYSSNYFVYDNSSRSSGYNLAVQTGYYIVFILGDLRDSTQSKYYALQLVKVPEVSLISTSPISVVATQDTAPTNELIGLPLSGSDNVLNIKVFKDVTTYITPLVYDDSTDPTKSSAATSCINGGNTILGDTAVTIYPRTDGAYYARHNICVNKAVISKYKTYYTKMNYILIAILILLIVVIIGIAVAAYFGKKLYDKHKSH